MIVAMAPTAAMTPTTATAPATVAADYHHGARIGVSVIVAVRAIRIGIGRRIATSIGAGAVLWGGGKHVGDDVLAHTRGAQALYVGLPQPVAGIGLIDVVDDERRGNRPLGKLDQVVERKRVAIEHLVIDAGRDVVGAKDGAVLAVHGLATGEEDGDEEQREKAKAFHMGKICEKILGNSTPAHAERKAQPDAGALSELHLPGHQQLQKILGRASPAQVFLCGGILENARQCANDAQIIGRKGDGNADDENKMNGPLRVGDDDPCPGTTDAHDHAGDAIGAGMGYAQLGTSGVGKAGLLAGEPVVKGIPIRDAIVLLEERGDMVDGLFEIEGFQVQIDVLRMKNVCNGNHSAVIERCRSI